MCAPALFAAMGATEAAAAGLAAASTLAIGAYGQHQQQSAQDDYNNKQTALERRQKQLAMQQQDVESAIGKEKTNNIIDEAGKVNAAAPRQEAMQQAESTANTSNVQALEQAQALGSDALGKSYEGGQSDAYLNARAQAAADQTSKAIGMARLFAKQGAVGNAMQNQAIGAIDNSLQDQALNFRVHQSRRGYDNGQDLIGKQQSAMKFDDSAGQMASAIGGTLFNANAKAFGDAAGKAGGLGKLFG